MPPYFKPLRRKIGLVTLGLACLLTVGWVRSRTQIDAAELVAFGLDFTAFSSGGRLILRASDQASTWESYIYEDGLLKFTEVKSVEWKFRTNKPFVYCFNTTELPKLEVVCGCNTSSATISYWSIVIPLTLLSAYLLLSRPRVPKPKLPSTENAS